MRRAHVGVVEVQVVGVEEHGAHGVGTRRVGVHHLAGELEHVVVAPAVGQVDGGVDGGVGDPDVGGHDDGGAAPRTVFHTGCHSVADRVSDTAMWARTRRRARRCASRWHAGRVCPRSRSRTPSAVNGIPKWITLGSVSSQWMLVTRRSPTSQPLAGALRALTRKPPSTLVAVPLDRDPVRCAG